MGPVKDNLVPRLQGGYLFQDVRPLQDGLVRRINVDHQLLLLFIPVLAGFPVIQILDNPEGGEILGVVALVRTEGGKEPALAVNNTRKLRLRHMV